MMRGKKLPPPVGYGLAVLLAALAQLSRLPLHPPTLIPYITYAPFVLLSAYQGGWGPGALTTILCTIESLYFATEPVGSLLVRDPQDWLGLGALALSGIVASALFGRLQQAQTVAAAAEFARSEMAHELEARRRMLESVIEHSPVSIALLRGHDFRFEMVNPAYQALAPGEPMTGRTVAEVWPEAAPGHRGRRYAVDLLEHRHHEVLTGFALVVLQVVADPVAGRAGASGCRDEPRAHMFIRGLCVLLPSLHEQPLVGVAADLGEFSVLELSRSGFEHSVECRRLDIGCIDIERPSWFRRVGS